MTMVNDRHLGRDTKRGIIIFLVPGGIAAVFFGERGSGSGTQHDWPGNGPREAPRASHDGQASA